MRAYAEVRVAFDRAGRSECEAVVGTYVRHRSIRGGCGEERGTTGRHEAVARRRDRASGLSCAGTEHGAKGGRDAAADPGDTGRCGGALLRPWRHLWRGQADARGGG